MSNRIKVGQRVLITGASFGLGHELSKLYARDGYDLVLVARSADKLEQDAQVLRQRYGVEVKVIAKDMATPTAARELYEALKLEGVTIDVLVNNAGFGTYGRFCDTELASEEREIQLNAVTPTQMCKLFMQDMIARGRGHIVNMASMAAFMPGPYMTIYFATKAYLFSFSESIGYELKGSGVKVTVVCPNVVDTKFQETAHNKAALIGGRIRSMMVAADKAAAQIYNEIQQGREVVIPGASNKFTVALIRLLPHKLILPVIAFINRGPDIPRFPSQSKPR